MKIKILNKIWKCITRNKTTDYIDDKNATFEDYVIKNCVIPLVFQLKPQIG